MQKTNMVQQILGAEAISYTTPFEPTWVIKHCKELRKIHELKHAHFVIGVESNGNGTERQHQRWHIESSSLKNKTVLREAAGGKLPGIVTTDTMKEQFSRKLREDLMFKRVRFHKDFVCICSGKKVTPGMMKEKLLQQLGMFHRITLPPSKEYQRAKIVYTGKMHGGKDDVVMAIFLSMYSGVLYDENREKYKDEMYKMI